MYFIRIYKEIYYKELAHMIMKAKKFHSQQLAKWKPRRANDIAPN